MFGYLRRFFNDMDIFIFILILYGTTYIYPPAQESIRGILAENKEVYVEWINVLMSIFTVMLLVGLGLSIIILMTLFILFSDEENSGWMPFSNTSKIFFRNGFWWSINLLLLSKFCGLDEVWNYWINFYFRVWDSKALTYILISLTVVLSIWVLSKVYTKRKDKLAHETIEQETDHQ